MFISLEHATSGERSPNSSFYPKHKHPKPKSAFAIPILSEKNITFCKHNQALSDCTRTNLRVL